jgi:hypothetical protein
MTVGVTPTGGSALAVVTMPRESMPRMPKAIGASKSFIVYLPTGPRASLSLRSDLKEEKVGIA